MTEDEPLCPSCLRISKVWPSLIIKGVGGHKVNAICAEFDFHGFTSGESGTIVVLYACMEALGKELRK